MPVANAVTTKKVLSVIHASPVHWVGDGFPVSTVISPQTAGTGLSPFLMMDYAGPAEFKPAREPRGVDSHPHKGFETVTVVFQGELEHRDSARNKGSIGPGDVQWMTAGSGILHEEKHSARFTREGGVMEMAQLWVNLPAKDKKQPPKYQELTREKIPTVTLPGGAGTVRVIAGDFNGTRAAATTFTPVVLWDVKLRAGSEAAFPVPAGQSAAVFVRSGSVSVDGANSVGRRQLIVFETEGDGFALHAVEDAEVLIVGGEPINEPVVSYGPFVMNTQREIQEAIADFRAGKMGYLD